ncbi:MAG: M24 family metallopeptidase [Ilumatobacteraceae bacterium]
MLCDFGGTMNGYCSDITRCVFTGDVAPDVAEAYAVLHEAQAAAVAAATVGTPCQDVDRAARRAIADAGYGEYFVHRTGHGIGLEEHEDPYIVEGNATPLEAGHALSIEPGIYVRARGHAPRGHRRRRHRRSDRDEHGRPRFARRRRLIGVASGVSVRAPVSRRTT